MLKTLKVIDKFQIKTKLFSSFSLMLGLAGIIALLSAVSLNKLGDKVEVLSAEDIPLVVSMGKVGATQLRQQIAVERMVRHSQGGSVYQKKFQSDVKDFEDLVK